MIKKVVNNTIAFVGGIISAAGIAVLTNYVIGTFEKFNIAYDTPIKVSEYTDKGDKIEWVEFRLVSNPNILCVVSPNGQTVCIKD